MNDFFENHKKLFLDNDDSNFDSLLESIGYIEKKIKETYSLNDSIFFNNSIANKFNNVVPQRGKKSKEVLDEIIPAFKDLIRWNHSNTLHNITSPSLLDGVAAKTITSLYNPNCIWDYVSGNFIPLEEAVSSQIAALVGYDKNHLGTFTFGGKGTLLYAIRLGLNRCDRGSVTDGIDKDSVVLTSTANHYSIEYICTLVGLGKRACIRIPTDERGLIDLNKFNIVARELLSKNKKIACIILSGGNSLNNTIEPFEKVNSLIEELVREYRLPYKPFVHADSVIGWLWLMYKNYDFIKNPLSITQPVLNRIREATEKISTIHFADSIGVDFHKNAFASYVSSLYLCKNGDELYSMNTSSLVKRAINKYGNNFLQHYTVEHSRSGDGIISAYVSLQELGIDGFQEYIAKMMTLNDYIRRNIDNHSFDIINQNGLGFPVIVFPKSSFIFGQYDSLIKNTRVDFVSIQDYCHGLFNTISAMQGRMAPVIGYISNYSKSDNGYDIPAFKIYPMSHNTDEVTLKDALTSLVKIKEEYDINYKESYLNRDKAQGFIFPK